MLSLNDGPWMFLVHVRTLPFTFTPVACVEGNVHVRCSPFPLILNPKNSNGPASTSKSQLNLLPLCILELPIKDDHPSLTFAFMLPVDGALSEATFPSELPEQAPRLTEATLDGVQALSLIEDTAQV